MKNYTIEKSNIPKNLKMRLDYYKKHFPTSWRNFIKHRDGYTKFGQCTETYSREKNLLFSNYEFDSQIGYSDEFINLNHTGWFESEDFSGTLRGAVLRIRGAKYTQYVPAVIFSDAQCHYADFKNAFYVDRGSNQDAHDEAIKDCARMADRMAEIDAEECRENDKKYKIECEIEDLKIENIEIRKHVENLISGIRKSKLDSILCENIKNQIKGLHNELKRNIEKIKESKNQLSDFN